MEKKNTPIKFHFKEIKMCQKKKKKGRLLRENWQNCQFLEDI